MRLAITAVMYYKQILERSEVMTTFYNVVIRQLKKTLKDFRTKVFRKIVHAPWDIRLVYSAETLSCLQLINISN